MSLSSLQSNVQHAHSDIASLSKKLSDLTGKLADKSHRLADSQNAANRASSPSTLQSKLREAAGLLKDIAGIEKDKANVEKQIGDRKRVLHGYEQALAKEQERETKKQIDANKRRVKEMGEADKRRRREMDEYQRNLDRDLSSRILASHTTDPVSKADEVVKKYDFFISHASEDKEDFVHPLAEALTARSLAVWYDQFQLKVGDSLRQSIDRGLVNSRYGVVVLSSAFFAKNWPQYELNGLVAREMNGVKVVLPIWHKVTKDEVLRFSPPLADKVALNSSLLSIDEIADELADVVGVKPFADNGDGAGESELDHANLAGDGEQAQ